MSDQGDQNKTGDEAETGVDVSLIRWTLSLSPEERLAWNDSMVNLILELRRGMPPRS